jgi:uncharacterized protein YecT (DUF1311 family)
LGIVAADRHSNHWTQVREPQRRPGVADPVQKLSPHTIALIVLGALLLAALIFLFTRDGDSGQDILGDNQVGSNVTAEDPEERCADPANNDRIKRELFRRAAAVRARDQTAYDRLVGFAVLRSETPILRGYDQRVNSISCSAFVSLDLPPGVAVAGGKRTLSGDVGYAIQGASLTLTEAEAIVAPLATLARDGQPPEAGLDEPAVLTADGVEENAAVSEPANQEAGSETVYPGRPSFDCDDAVTRGEVAVCNNASLSALDVTMATQYRRALAAASPAQRTALIQTRDRFLAYRDNCPTVGCIRDAYVGRMREIRDIAEGR